MSAHAAEVMTHFTVTFFPNHGATSKREELLTLPDLANLIGTTSAVIKDNLPWLKLGMFGDLRSDRNSLRHNTNVLMITGIEGDYDQGRVEFNDAVAILAEGGVKATVYTSPSHTDVKPRWRVLCPLSGPVPPEQRDRYMARLNGLFGGIFARESWTLSQSYFYGSVNHNPDHRVELIAGRPIDLLHDLDATAIGKPGTKTLNGHANEKRVGFGAACVPASNARLEGYRGSILDNLRRQAVDGQKHAALRSAALTLGGIQAEAGFTDAQAVAWLLEVLPASVDDWNAAKQTAIWGLEQGRQKPIDLPDRTHVGNGARYSSEPSLPDDPLENRADIDLQDAPSDGQEYASERPSETTFPPNRGANEHGRPADSNDGFDLTEDGIALAFAAKHRGFLRFDHHAGAWFQWNGNAWRREETKLAFSWARALCRKLAQEKDAGARVKVALAKAATAGAVERFAQADRAFAVTSEVWDCDPWLLGTPDGTVDLRSGTMRPPKLTDYITKVTKTSPAATADCPRWLKFLEQATRGDLDLIGYLQRWLGYSLTGITREHALMFVWGPGGNGKGVMLNTVFSIMGQYATNAAIDSFVLTRGDKHSTDMAMLHGARLVLTTEVDEGRTWDAARIKALTGGDPITARFMRRDNFTFTPQFKLSISGNHKPGMKSVDPAMRRRVNLVLFLYQAPVVNRVLAEQIKAEWPGILRWLINGCLEWQRVGLNPPKVVLDATEEYFEAQDHYGRWLAERCILDPGLRIRPSAALAGFQEWCRTNGEPDCDSRTMRALIEKTPGLRYVKIDGLQWVRGIGLKPAANQEGAENDERYGDYR